MPALPLNVLMVEDNPDDAELVLRELRRAGFNPDWHRVQTKDEFLAHLDPAIDLILSDYSMPGFSGPQALQLLQERNLCIPFIIISGTIGEEVAVEVMKMGATDYLLKDRLMRLGLSIGHALEKGRSQRDRNRIEEELRTTHGELQRLLDHSPAVVYSLKVAGSRVIPQMVSANVTRLLGFSAQETFTPDWWHDQLHPEDKELAIAALSETLERGSFTSEYRLRHKAGPYVWVEDHMHLICDATGNPVEIAGTWIDITERKRTELALRRQQAELQVLFDLMPAMIWFKDTRNNFLRANQRVTQATGLPIEEIEGKSAEALYPKEAAGYYADDLEIISSGAPKLGIIEKLHGPHGEDLWIQTDKVPYCDEHGNVIGIVVMAQDVSERKRSEEVIRESEQRFSGAFEFAPIGMALVAPTGRWLKVNRALCEMVGYPEAELLKRTFQEMTHPDDLEEDLARARLLIAGDIRSYQVEKRYIHASGSAITVLLSVSLVRDREEKPLYFIAQIQDITERKQLEKQFLRAQRMESIGTLAGGIAHDLNNVLAPIMMSIDLLKMKENDPTRVSILATIAGSARRGADMVQQVLSFARGVEGQKVEVQITRLLKEVEKISNDTFLKNIQVRCDFPATLWTVQGDPTQLHQVLLNLCVNARDAMPQGGTLTLSAANIVLDETYTAANPEAKPGPHVILQVEDTGTGMPQEIIERIFEPFFTTKELGKGTGLGLSTTIAIVKSHGGCVRVDSIVGSGTKFQVYLPAQVAAQSAHEASPRDELPHGNGELILVIDDEAAIRDITRQTLEAFGYRVLLAKDGAEATAIYATRKKDIAVVLTDMMMPVMDGPTTIHVLLRMNPQLKIIAASGLNADGMVAKAANAGVKHFIPKPYTAETLLNTLHQRLHQ